MRDYFEYNDCKDREQALCSVFGNQIQRCCDFKKSKDNCNYHVGFVHYIVGASSYFWNPITLWYMCIGLSLCLVIPTYSYTNIFLSLRHNQIQVQGYGSDGQPSQPTPLNKARYKKAVYSALWVQVALVLGYMPFGITRALTPHIKMSSSVYLARQFASTLAYFNSSLNPLLYCLKIREVRKAGRDTIRDLFCSLN